MPPPRSPHHLLGDKLSPYSLEPISGSTSPHIIKPLAVHKQRLSSMNSVTSNQSVSHTRSMSIISLGSPRNSIVSIDDGFRPTRNNSLTLLASLSTPADEPDNYTLANHPKLKALKNSSAIISDDESDTESFLKRRVKRDFQFDYLRGREDPDKFEKPRLDKPRTSRPTDSDSASSTTPTPGPSGAPARPILPSISATSSISPIPLGSPSIPSISRAPGTGTTQKVSHSTSTAAKPSAGSTPITRNPVNPTSSVPGDDHKKSRPGLMLHPIYSKKKKFFSKDLQMELLLSSPQPNLDKHIDTKFVSVKRTPTLPLLPSSKHSILNEKLRVDADQPIMSTLQLQNMLISHLNRKWNKTTEIEEPQEKDKSRKRSRDLL